jgi:hypothetical protein
MIAYASDPIIFYDQSGDGYFIACNKLLSESFLNACLGASSKLQQSSYLWLVDTLNLSTEPALSCSLPVYILNITGPHSKHGPFV